MHSETLTRSLKAVTEKGQSPGKAEMEGEPVTAYDKLEAAAVEAQTPPRSSRSSSATTAPTSVSDLASDISEISVDSPSKSPWQKPAPFVRTTKASLARITLIHGPKDRPQLPSLGRPSQQVQSPSTRTVSSSSSASTGSKDGDGKKEVIIPHSKPRPMAMAFPAPPPLAKSTRVPTQSNFQLPGEAIAAKLKAAKEARAQKDAEEQKKRTFKARPVPASHAKGAAVRHTNTSIARESLVTRAKPAVSPTDEITQSAATTRSSSSSISDRQACQALSPSQPSISSRPSTAMALSNTQAEAEQSCVNSAPSTRPASTVPSATRTAGTSKGKEAWDRVAHAQEAVERERREREDAAKKARAEAAERSRMASREWADKQRVKKMVAKMEGNAHEDGISTPTQFSITAAF